ncbi:MAG: DUF4115 domain-containing protein [Actinobacteria bacterium]|nr:DUF4115 domain-containing protein [Actinomycetota bacterium]
MNTSLEKIGRELAQQREARGLSIEDLSSRIKISIGFIENIEKGDFDFLPAVYVRAFIRSYAEEVGLDPEVMLARFKAAKKPQKPAEEIRMPGTVPKSKAKQKKQASKTHEHELAQRIKDLQFYFTLFKPFILVGIGIVILFVIIRLLLPGTNNTPARPPQPKVSESVPDTLVDESQPSREIQQAKTISSSLQLTITAIETTWMRIVVNDTIADEATFAPGDMRTWESNKDFYLLIGNAGGVRFNLNGKNLGIVGNPGQVANLLINKNGVKRIPYSSLPSAMNRARRIQ